LGDTVTAHLADAVDATLARMEALREADAQLERRRTAIRGMHYEDGLTKSEVARVLYNELRERGLTTDQLEDQGVGFHSVMRVLRTPS
jgi:hypothetical protein